MLNRAPNSEKYNEELEILKIRLAYITKTIDEFIIQESMFNNELRKLEKFIKNIDSINESSDKLDFIRSMISKVIVDQNDGKLKFKIIYKFQI